LNRSRDIAAARILENLGAIEQFWAAAGSRGSSAIHWARAELARDSRVTDPELAALQSLQNAYSRLANYPERLADAELALQSARAAAIAAQQQATAYMQTMAKDAGEVVAVLQAARDYLAKHPMPQACPLCESTDAAQGLSARIARRLDSFATFQRFQGMQRSASYDLQRAEQQRSILLAQARKDALAFEEIRALFDWSSDVKLPEAPAPQDFDLLATWLTENASLPENWQLAEIARQDRRQFLATLRGALSTFEENIQGQQLLQNWQIDMVSHCSSAIFDTIWALLASMPPFKTRYVGDRASYFT